MTNQSDPFASNYILEATSFLFGSNAAFIEALYRQFLDNPNAVDPSWRQFFAGLGERSLSPAQLGRGPAWHRDQTLKLDGGELIDALTGAPGPRPALAAPPAGSGGPMSEQDLRMAAQDSIRAIQLVRAYRMIGHLAADLDPLKLSPRPPVPQLEPSFHGFHDADLDRPVFMDGVLGMASATPRQLVASLKQTYCGRIGYEFLHITDPEQKDWLQRRIEGPESQIQFTVTGKKAILNKLIEAEGFEKFAGVRFLGTKRFGLDGGEAMIPALEQILKRGGQLGVQEIVLGMAHRGRLNVLANVLAKPYRQIFHEFQGGSSVPSDVQGSGDVKYHLGASSDREFDGNMVHLSLTANPSHLEASNPVCLGKARAKQQQLGDKIERSTVMPLLIHGDAAFAGQGVVAECFAMSGTKGFRTGGTLHFVINNQIGFTTAPAYSRSSPYCTDIALMVQAPIFHVNGDDPEAVVHCARIAAEFRQLFHKDVVIDMVCYRRFGHNENDEPAFTQPLMYRAIKDHPTTLEIYATRLVADGVITQDGVKTMREAFSQHIEAEYEASKTHRPDHADWLDRRWQGFSAAPQGDRRGETAVGLDALQTVGKALTTIPEGFNAHRVLVRQLQAKAKMFETGEGIDWATAEALAFGTLLQEGLGVRLSGQDSGRGTFSQRHAMLVDQESERRYFPLSNISKTQAEFEVIDSLLSEEAVLGFEYGYTLAEPKTLTLWEAQYGDFANGAQVMIDQFITSGESKWLRMSGLVMLLPHGYEGQGPEHSSARLERYLQLCAEDNIQVAYCTTPANYFHILRRQLHRSFRKPLVVMAPKSMLRHKRVISKLTDLGPGSSFHRVLNDDAPGDASAATQLAADEQIRRVVFCTGKVYYDLYEEREARKETRIQLMRLEQLYPYPFGPVADALRRFPNAELVWCQEEPQNQGAWTFIAPRLESSLREAGRKDRPRYTGRPESASPAAGLMSQHNTELKAFLNEALSL